MKNRALWLMNHFTLRQFEVPLLIEMGFEVYCPNSFPYDEGNMSASVDRQYDKTLSIDAETLEKLNQIDFYGELSRDAISLINTHFDIVFMGFFPEQFYSIVANFEGVIIFQPFGLAAGATYTDILYQTVGPKVFEALRMASGRFFFGQAYRNLDKIEGEYFQEHAIYLPLGLKNAYVTRRWRGGDNRILFVCPRIYSTQYFGNIYKEFKKNFSGYDYVVGGAQPINDKSDRHIVGFVDDQEYEYNMTHLGVMFYHSRERRHLHYHPLEAVKNGMPLIFMSGGMLDELGGKNLPGRCETIGEARKKIDRIFLNDQKFIEEIIKSQEGLLHDFTYDFCKETWRDSFLRVWSSLGRYGRTNRKKKSKKVAVLLTEGYTGGVLDVTLRMVYALHRGIQESGSNTQLVFGYRDLQVFSEKDYFAPIRDLGISIRPFLCNVVGKEYIKNCLQLIGGFNPQVEQDEYCVFDDGIQGFDDCDAVLFVVDRCPARIFLKKPHVVLVHDYLQRYMPYVYGSFYEDCVLRMARESVRTLVMSPPTYTDAIMYAGLEKKKLALIPLMFDLIRIPETRQSTEDEPEDYFIWSTNLGEHKNHLMALKALAGYYNAGGRLKCYITGVGTDAFDPESDVEVSPYVAKIRKLIERESLAEKLVFCGNMSKTKYIHVLRLAKFFMHPGLMDNGNMTAVDAACLGVPTISSNYPQMRYYEEYMHLNIRFFDPYSEKSLTETLLKTENDYEILKQGLPTREELELFTIGNTYKDIYCAVADALKL